MLWVRALGTSRQSLERSGKLMKLSKLSGSVQGQAGWSSEQPGLVEGVPAHGRGVGTR